MVAGTNLLARPGAILTGERAELPLADSGTQRDCVEADGGSMYDPSFNEWSGVLDLMKGMNTLMLFIGVLYLLIATLFLMSLLPIGQRLVQRLELRLKPGAKTIAGISRLRRAVFILASGLYAAVAFTSAFQRSFGSPVVVLLMIVLPALYLLLGIWDGEFKRKFQPDA